jgi:hypothetical protein
MTQENLNQAHFWASLAQAVRNTPSNYRAAITILDSVKGEIFEAKGDTSIIDPIIHALEDLEQQELIQNSYEKCCANDCAK